MLDLLATGCLKRSCSTTARHDPAAASEKTAAIFNKSHVNTRAEMSGLCYMPVFEMHSRQATFLPHRPHFSRKALAHTTPLHREELRTAQHPVSGRYRRAICMERGSINHHCLFLSIWYVYTPGWVGEQSDICLLSSVSKQPSFVRPENRAAMGLLRE